MRGGCSLRCSSLRVRSRIGRYLRRFIRCCFTKRDRTEKSKRKRFSGRRRYLGHLVWQEVRDGIPGCKGFYMPSAVCRAWRRQVYVSFAFIMEGGHREDNGFQSGFSICFTLCICSFWASSASQQGSKRILCFAKSNVCVILINRSICLVNRKE